MGDFSRPTAQVIPVIKDGLQAFLFEEGMRHPLREWLRLVHGMGAACMR